MEAKLFCFLEIIGVGYKAITNPQGSILYLKLGFSHEIRLQVTSSVRVFCFKPNPICCTRIDHQKVTPFAANVKSCKPPEVYKGKGIQYRNEILHKKQGKKIKIMSYIL
jgi:large subunit ribosomal protein L6